MGLFGSERKKPKNKKVVISANMNLKQLQKAEEKLKTEATRRTKMAQLKAAAERIYK